MLLKSSIKSVKHHRWQQPKPITIQLKYTKRVQSDLSHVFQTQLVLIFLQHSSPTHVTLSAWTLAEVNTIKEQDRS